VSAAAENSRLLVADRVGSVAAMTTTMIGSGLLRRRRRSAGTNRRPPGLGIAHLGDVESWDDWVDPTVAW